MSAHALPDERGDVDVEHEDAVLRRREATRFAAVRVAEVGDDRLERHVGALQRPQQRRAPRRHEGDARDALVAAFAPRHKHAGGKETDNVRRTLLDTRRVEHMALAMARTVAARNSCAQRGE